jgi:hypothetical protein
LICKNGGGHTPLQSSTQYLCYCFAPAGKPSKNDLPKKDYPKLYAAKVVKAAVVNKPLDNVAFKFGWISHSGVV